MLDYVARHSGQVLDSQDRRGNDDPQATSFEIAAIRL